MLKFPREIFLDFQERLPFLQGARYGSLLRGRGTAFKSPRKGLETRPLAMDLLYRSTTFTLVDRNSKNRKRCFREQVNEEELEQLDHTFTPCIDTSMVKVRRSRFYIFLSSLNPSGPCNVRLAGTPYENSANHWPKFRSVSANVLRASFEQTYFFSRSRRNSGTATHARRFTREPFLRVASRRDGTKLIGKIF